MRGFGVPRRHDVVSTTVWVVEVTSWRSGRNPTPTQPPLTFAGAAANYRVLSSIRLLTSSTASCTLPRMFSLSWTAWFEPSCSAW